MRPSPGFGPDGLPRKVARRQAAVVMVVAMLGFEANRELFGSGAIPGRWGALVFLGGLVATIVGLGLFNLRQYGTVFYSPVGRWRAAAFCGVLALILVLVVVT